MANGHSLGGTVRTYPIFSKHATTGDGILTSLMLMEVIIEKTVIKHSCIRVSIYPQLLENVHVANKTAARNNEEVKEGSCLGGERIRKTEEFLCGKVALNRSFVLW